MNNYFNQIAKNVLESANYTYKIDVTTGLVYEDIIDSSGFNFTKQLGLTTPCKFNDLINHSFDKNFFDAEYSFESNRKDLSTENFRNAYENGVTEIEATIYWKSHKTFHRLNYFLTKDSESDHIIAYALARDVTPLEAQRNFNSKSAQRELAETSDIIASANMGIWRITLIDGQEPKFQASKKMLGLLGLQENTKLSEEEIYVQWNSRIKNSARPAVEDCVSKMISKGNAEITYQWTHPEKGDIYVRCGGTSQKVEGGYVLRGYHYNVTEYVTSDIKYKQLLQDTLVEVQNQKKLLQEALDNYKQADYDRRTDFLTGLRNRQDMFKFLQDSLSAKRQEIRAMFMMDIDNFKMLNDKYGHLYGDECLQAIGSSLTNYGKENNIYFYRYGGEEILGIALQNEKAINIIADELVKLVYDLDIKRDDVEQKRVTISLGFTTDNSRYEKMIDKADKAMYFAKQNGKNRAANFDDL